MELPRLFLGLWSSLIYTSSGLWVLFAPRLLFWVGGDFLLVWGQKKSIPSLLDWMAKYLSTDILGRYSLQSLNCGLQTCCRLASPCGGYSLWSSNCELKFLLSFQGSLLLWGLRSKAAALRFRARSSARPCGLTALVCGFAAPFHIARPAALWAYWMAAAKSRWPFLGFHPKYRLRDG